MNKTVRFITLGCKTNIYESEAMAQMFENAGYGVISDKSADICVINTCTVTAVGAAKSMKMIRRARRDNPNAIVAVCGCLAQTEGERIKREADPHVLIGNDKRRSIVDMCKAAESGERVYDICDISRVECFEELGSVHRQKRIRAEVKIEDGCNNFCSYCKIPYARGRVRSRDIENIISEVKDLKNDGFSEVVLTGIHIGSYGRDLKNGLSLTDVIERISPIACDMRIRLGSLEPAIITEDFVGRTKNIKNLCPHFHLSLQSGCDKTLSAMNRRYDTEQFKNAVASLRHAFSDCAITTDLIVGFPGETEDDFENSKRFCEEIGFAKMHIFPYSVREGTRAEALDGKVSEEEKRRRTNIMLASAEKMRKAFCSAYTGKTTEVLFEQKRGEFFCGLMKNYTEVRVKSEKNLRGKLLSVKIDGYDEKSECLMGEIII